MIEHLANLAADNGAELLRQLRDISGIETLPPLAESPRWDRWALLTLAVTGALVLSIRVRRLLVRPEPAPTPEQWAARELARIEALNLPAQGEANRYHTDLADVVRRYLEMRHGLAAPRQTTTEFLAAARLAPQLTDEQRDRLREFLGRCDLAKFAGTTMTVEECTATGIMAVRLVGVR
jgi:hypothetical protein